MASRFTTFASIPKKEQEEAEMEEHRILMAKINLCKEKIQGDRTASIKDKLRINGENLRLQLSKVLAIMSRKAEEDIVHIFSSKINHPLHKFDGFSKGSRKDEEIINHDIFFEESIMLPEEKEEKIPRFTFWSHLVRNKIMTKDQAFSARRNIYYDQHGEALICSDPDEEVKENREVKHDFSHGEDQIIWMAFEEHNLTEELLSIVRSCIGRTCSEIQERYKYLKEKDMHSRENGSSAGICLDKSLSEAINTLDHLFCRRCMIYDCPFHECPQRLLYPTEKQPTWNVPENERQPCGEHCYLELKDANTNSTPETLLGKEIKTIETVDDVFASSSSKKITDKIELMRLSNSMEKQEQDDSSDWKPLEKELCLKGIEMFGKNSCLIFRNLLCGFKTCVEIGIYMSERFKDHEIPSSSRKSKRKGKSKRFFHRRRNYIGREQNGPLNHYTPCECQGMCGKECPCYVKGPKGTCEKYCGCAKQCNNRYKGCLCEKGQCDKGYCPCFAEGRECDPDVCINCWVRCGDGSSQEPPNQEKGQCKNMKVFLGRKQKILLGPSEVAGWGAFIKNPVKKDEYLGEYTGELISHEEAEKRGTLYEHAGFSYLFDLDDKYCIDAYRMGNKLKFANHSSEPNCYPRGVFVGGDHRIGIFAKEDIKAGEELFYDYHYTKYQKTPKWFRELSKEKESNKNSRGKGKVSSKVK
ncbi:[histone H3]-lysine(4) N-trimethyltransferase [Trifolium repens]|nr:[histone H3]-lysine(4) N-trimethyltransferase [Trifolium repens]